MALATTAIVKSTEPTAAEAAARGTSRILIWDWPTRVTHWAFVVMVALAWATTYGHMDWHRDCGYAILGLLVFRFYWGVAGSTPSRFASFVRGPIAVLAYLKALPNRAAPKSVGHNPLGALSVVALLVVRLAQTVLGLFTVDVDGIESGPLASRVSFEVGRACGKWHHLLFNGLLALIGLHLAAILFYALYKRDNLVGPMVHGRKRLPPQTELVAAPWPRVVIGVILSAVAVWLTSRAFKL